jgi:type II secretion system protein H
MIPRRPRRDGFTLVEMLAVLAVVAVVAGVATLGAGIGGRERDVEIEARRLAGQLALAADEALVTGRTLYLDWDDRGYRVVILNAEGAREPYGIETLGERHDLPGGLRLRSDAPRPAPVGAEGQGQPFEMDLEAGRAVWRVAYDGLDATASAEPAG